MATLCIGKQHKKAKLPEAGQFGQNSQKCLFALTIGYEEQTGWLVEVNTDRRSEARR